MNARIPTIPALTQETQGVGGLTEKDLRTGLWVWGLPGKGKSDTIIRPVIHAWRQLNRGGILFLDFKGDGPTSMMNHLDYVVDPFRAYVNVIAGMEPAIVAKVYKSLAETTSKDGGIWTTSSANKIQQGATILQYLVAQGTQVDGRPLAYCIRDLYSFCQIVEFRKGILSAFSDSHILGMPMHLQDAFRYFNVEYPAFPKDTAGSIDFSINSYIGSAFLGHPLMSRWAGARSETTINGVRCEISPIHDVLRGKAVGITAPEDNCGQGGVMAIGFLKAAFQTAILARGADTSWRERGEKPVLFAADETSAGLSSDGSDADFVSKCRSLECCTLWMAQTIGLVEKKLGKEGARALVGMFGSMATFKTDQETTEYAATKAGSREQIVTEGQTIDVSLGSTAGAAAAGAGNDDKGRIASLLDSATNLWSHRRKQITLRDPNNHETESSKISTQKAQIKTELTISPKALDTALSVPFQFLLVANRANSVRREIYRMPYDPHHPMRIPPTAAQLASALIDPEQELEEIAGLREGVMILEAGKLIEASAAHQADLATFIAQLNELCEEFANF